MTDAAINPRGLLLWVWRGYLAKHWRLLMVAMVFMALEGGMFGALSYMMKPMFDRVFVGGDADAIVWVGLIFFGIFIVRALASIVQKVMLTHISQLSVADIRQDLLAHLMVLDTQYHQSHSPGYLMQRVEGDVDAISKVWRTIITGAGRDVIALISLFAVAISVDWRWTLVALIGAPLLVAPSMILQRYVRKKARRARDVAAKLSVRLNEAFHGIIPVKLNALETYQSERYRVLTEERVKVETRTALGQATIPGMIDIMAGLGFMGVLFYGGNEILSGDKTVGDFMAFFTAIGLAFEPLRRLGNVFGVWQVAAAGIERIRQILDTTPEMRSPAQPVSPPSGVPDIAFEDIALSYGDTSVLHGCSFSAEAGQTTALVGPSGAGKSTIFNVLTRLVDPSSGSVRIGGVPVADMDLGALRGLFSVVSQEALLFDDTVRENILLGQRDVPEADLKNALEAAHVTDFLPQLSDGLDTPVGPRGSALSGGQRQRVAIARALLRNRPILLLDEATSALDTGSEAKVQAALDELSKGRTTLVIAHRLSTIRDAHKIVVMDQGRVIEQGSHDALIENAGTYAALHQMQVRS
ncbi:ABC transporter ATP-binding protein/permease [Marivita sp. S6314]|uniref:ABC transporter ATP-binding protein n=1 Tax=Marivita sp. S6314 TaxID=2926406 RepID=UPI001FF573C1|nr:ABC transporter ATP-binding protein [Marivita sp. S6314]MCK0149185.1 ABC transporter ATP-binding protein/permease [Marivita sp. S6314]